MNVPRETIYNALLGRAESISPYPFKLVSRQPQPWTNLDAGNLPALFQWERGETEKQTTYGLGRWTAKVAWMVLFQPSQNASDVVASRMNPVLDALEASLLADVPGQKQTLGGLVENAWIDGEVIKELGVLSTIAALVIPITVITGF